MGFSLGGLMLAALASWAQVRKPDFIIMLFVVSSLFGASAVVTLHFLGGRPILPGTFMLPFLFLYVLRMPHVMVQIKRALVQDPAVVLFVVFSIFAIMITTFTPFLMKDQTMVYDVEKGKFVLKVLAFSSSHIAQIIYLLGTVICFVLVVGLSRIPLGIEWFVKALMVLTALNAFFGLVDLIAFHLGFPDALMFLKNAGYAMVDQSMYGLRRISGVKAETSAFSSASVGMLAFNVTLYLKGLYRKYTGPLSAITAFLLLLTTSSSAYVGLLAISVGIMVIEWSRLKRFLINKSVFFVAVSIVVLAVILMCFFSEKVIQIFNATVTTKLDSDSGVERMGWNYQAWQNTLDTYFLGVGLGGNRASSLIMVVMSNVGIIGFILFFSFLAMSVVGCEFYGDKNDRVAATAAKLAGVTMLAPALIGATSFYMGMLFYIFIGLACSASGFKALTDRNEV